MPPTIVFTDISFPTPREEAILTQELNAQLVKVHLKTEEEVIATCAEADVLLVAFAPITRRVIENLKRCQLIVRYGIGYDMIDVDAATERGIAVCNVPDYCIEEVALHTVGLLLCCARKILQLDASMRAGRWDARGAAYPGHRLSQQTLGIVGIGRIGRTVARMAQALGLNVVAFDPFVSASDVAQMVSFDELLRSADYVTIHCPLTEGTRHLFNADAFSKMKPSAYLINCARGAIVDEQALIGALRQKRIAGAALDVYAQEPLPADSPLRHWDNVILQPHAAWYSEESFAELQERVAESVVQFFQGERPRGLVNPQVWKPRS
ncbi:MAG: C-terminal binding protein [Abditibacteriales bacterium]|nr:C-terminal binding protein [Abditibacteriales bacterium]MDW8367262.1 C-terminal binding protein [Abditibacteriales bacterium]